MTRSEQRAHSSNDLAWSVGLVFVSLGWWLGPLLSQWVTWLQFLGERSPRLGLSAVGMMLISGELGKEAQLAWSEDRAWSPRVIGNALASVAAGLVTLILYAIWLLDLDL